MKYNYLKALLDYPCTISIKWDVDEMQADPIQNTWTWGQAKKELMELIASQQDNSADDNSDCSECDFNRTANYQNYCGDCGKSLLI